MAISPRRTGFLQQTSERRVGRNISNFRIRTGQKFPDIARGRLFEQELVQEQAEKQQQARVGIALKGQEQEQERFEKRLGFTRETQEDVERRRKERGRALGALAGAGVGFKAGFPFGGVVGATVGGIVGAVAGGK